MGMMKMAEGEEGVLDKMMARKRKEEEEVDLTKMRIIWMMKITLNMEDGREANSSELKKQRLFGWGRWEEILANAGLRKGFNPQLAEDAFRMTLLYCVNSYKGDDKIKSFVLDLITPPQYSGNKVVKNHAGLSG